MRLTPHVLGLLAGTVISTALGGCGGAVIDEGSTTTVAASRESDPTPSTTSTTTSTPSSVSTANANGTETETTDASTSGDESAVLSSQPGVGIGPDMDYAVGCGRG